MRRAPSGAPRAAPQIVVAVLASSRSTRDELAAYLQTTGFRAEPHTALDAEALGRARALVLFPDDFAMEVVQTFLRSLGRTRPGIVIVVITSARTELEPTLDRWAGRATPTVLPKPPFGWSIVETLRTRLAEV
jgi:hypothetical protein